MGPLLTGWFISMHWSTHRIFLALTIPALTSTVFIFMLRAPMKDVKERAQREIRDVCSLASDARPRLGAVHGDRIAEVTGFSSLLNFMTPGPTAWKSRRRGQEGAPRAITP